VLLGHYINCLLSFVVFVSVFQYQSRRLAGKNVSEVTCFVVMWDIKP